MGTDIYQAGIAALEGVIHHRHFGLQRRMLETDHLLASGGQAVDEQPQVARHLDDTSFLYGRYVVMETQAQSTPLYMEKRGYPLLFDQGEIVRR